MSETLRWILIGFAVVLLVCIYLCGRRGGQAASDDAHVRARPDPRIQPDDADRYVPPSDQGGAFSEPDSYDAAPAERWSISTTLHDREEEPYGSAVQPEPASAPERPELREAPSRRARVEPTFSDITAELPAESVIEPVAPEDVRAPEAAPSAQLESKYESAEQPAPTLSMSSTPAPRRIERRKIIALRLAAGPQRFEGARLRAALEGESLQHGKYQVFHRLHSQDVAIFSVASMVEPGTFDIGRMAESQFPGITLFAQLPGPVPGMHALNELVACARRLHQSLGGTLQDDRGVPLTVHRVERLRQEVREFERPPAAASSASAAHPTGS